MTTAMSDTWAEEKYAGESWCRLKHHNIIDGQPVLVCIHGGGWVGGGIEDKTSKNMAGTENLPKLGLGVVRATYRLAGASQTFPGVIWDLLRVHAWVKEKCPHSPLYWLGTSAGAHLSYTMLTNGARPKVDAFIGMYGFYHIERWAYDLSPNVKEMFKKFTDLSLVSYHNPIKLAYRVTAPTLLIHGSADTTIASVQSQILHDKLANSKLVITGEGHSTPVIDHVDKIAEFICSI